MGTRKNDAFPKVRDGIPGISKLEYFAGLAMQAILTTRPHDDGHTIEDVAVMAVQQAEELVKALDAAMKKSG